jgi:hypothetical protein
VWCEVAGYTRNPDADELLVGWDDLLDDEPGTAPAATGAAPTAPEERSPVVVLLGLSGAPRAARV